jgi:predicted methyltransferase
MRALLLIALAACKSSSSSAPPPDPDKIVALTDRTEHDRKLDPGRKPVETLKFFGLAPGMRVADLGAGGGYTTELVARMIGPTGKVYAQDTPNWDGPDLKGAWEKRTPRVPNVTHVMLPWESPLPPDATNLDVVTFVCAYHDVLAEKNDAHKLDAAVFAALKSGGTFVIIDNSAKDGTGAADAERLHRIDEKLVRADLEQAGFKLVAEADFLRNSTDARDWNADPGADARTHTQDRFVLKYRKP